MLMNNYVLIVGTHYVRIMECEYYGGDDPFTHGNEKQRERGTFYVHRTGELATSSYKGGSFKGMDLTIGDGIKGAGILIRSICLISSTPNGTGVPMTITYGETIEGPSLCVDKLCALGGQSSAARDWTLAELEQNVRIRKCTWDKQITPIYGCRVGLTLKRAPKDQMALWAKSMVSPLRACLFVPKKARDTFFVADPYRTDINTPRATISKYQSEYANGMENATTLLPTLGDGISLLTIAGIIASLNP